MKRIVLLLFLVAVGCHQSRSMEKKIRAQKGLVRYTSFAAQDAAAQDAKDPKDREIARLKEEIKQLEKEIARLWDDSLVIHNLARQYTLENQDLKDKIEDLEKKLNERR